MAIARTAYKFPPQSQSPKHQDQTLNLLSEFTKHLNLDSKKHSNSIPRQRYIEDQTLNLNSNPRHFNSSENSNSISEKPKRLVELVNIISSRRQTRSQKAGGVLAAYCGCTHPQSTKQEESENFNQSSEVTLNSILEKFYSFEYKARRREYNIIKYNIILKLLFNYRARIYGSTETSKQAEIIGTNFNTSEPQLASSQKILRQETKQSSSEKLPKRFPVKSCQSLSKPSENLQEPCQKPLKSPVRKTLGRPGKAPLEASQTVKTGKQLLSEKAQARAKRVAMGLEKRKNDETSLKVREMIFTYETILGEYCYEPTLKFTKGTISPEHRSFGQFKRAALIADQLEVSYEVFVRAQFYWFNKWFNRFPKPYELSGLKSKFPTPKRVKEYVKMVNNGSISGIVTGVGTRFQLDENEIDKYNEKMFNQLMQAWSLTEEEVMLRFARTGVGYFDYNWLKKNLVYKRLKAERKL